MNHCKFEHLIKITILVGVVNFIVTFTHIVQATFEVGEISSRVDQCQANISVLRNNIENERSR